MVETIRAQNVVDKLACFAAALADQSDDVYISRGAARHHPKQHTFAGARQSKHANFLPDSESQQTIDGSHPDIHRGRCETASHGFEWWSFEFDLLTGAWRRASVQGPAHAVKHSTDQPWTCFEAGPQRRDEVSRTKLMSFVNCEQQQACILETDHLTNHLGASEAVPYCHEGADR
jgi:hypothetical protein